MIIRNRAKCLICGEVIESTHRHDFRTCQCENLSVDGGFDYLRRCYQDTSCYKELSETLPDPAQVLPNRT